MSGLKRFMNVISFFYGIHLLAFLIPVLTWQIFEIPTYQYSYIQYIHQDYQIGSLIGIILTPIINYIFFKKLSYWHKDT